MTEVGRGAYGSVSIINGLAVKKFRKLSHLVQESVAGVFLKGQDHVVEFISADFSNLTLSMKCYSTTLRKWMNEVDVRTKEEKDEVVRQLLLGLIEIHSLHLVHGDIKPGNILIQKNPFKLVIADLGFISLRPFSKCERTAAIYRDTNVKSCPGHDIYSAGIIFLELYGELIIKEQTPYDELYEAIRNEIKDNVMRRILRDMLHKEHDKRPSAGQIYQKLFGEKKIYPAIDSNFEIYNEYPEIRAIMKKLAPKYSIERPNRGYKALCNYLESHKKKYKKYGATVYATCMIFILSSVFGRYSTFDQKDASKYCNINEKIIIKVTQELCLDNEIVQYLMTP